MDQTEEQKECHQQNTEGNESWGNKVENLAEIFHGMDEKLNTLADLIADHAGQARNRKCKYESGSADSRGKKKPELMLKGEIFFSHHVAEIMTRKRR